MKRFSIIFVFLFFIPVVLSQTCQDGTVQECENDKGICAGSVRICYNGVWGACSILPEEEKCNNGLDDDCDGLIDEECICKNEETRSCESWNLGICSGSIQICQDNTWSECDIKPQIEVCDNNADDDCDGQTDLEDENCSNVNHCTNRKKDFDEENVDCGGISCEPCPSCTDGIKSVRLGERKVNVKLENGTISDCGGLCPSCPTCHDGKKNQDEEQVDCGGPNCPSCESEEIIGGSEPIAFCGDDVCDITEDTSTCPEDCKIKSGLFLYFSLFFISFILIFLIYLILTKKGKRKKKETPIKIHSALLKPLPKNYHSEQLTDKLKKIK